MIPNRPGPTGPLIAASLMCARLDRLGEEVVRLDAAGIDAFHIDVMDGHFVPNLALGAATVRAIRPLTTSPIHVHLMVDSPEAYLAELASAGTDVVFFHLEATRHPLRVAASAEARGLTPGLAISPSTPIPELRELLDLPHLMLMAVEPGFAGGAWVPSSEARVRELRTRAGARTQIHVDGHVDAQTVSAWWAAGATWFVGGSTGLFTGPDADFRTGLSVLRSRGLPASTGIDDSDMMS